MPTAREHSEEAQSRGFDVRPIPDPTQLTTQQLLREMSNLKEVIFTRLDGMDAAVRLLQETAARSPTTQEVYLQHEEKFRSIFDHFEERDKRFAQQSQAHITAVNVALKTAEEARNGVAERTAHLEQLHGEKFRFIATQFQERDTRTEQTSRDSKVAVDAALQAAKEAVGAQNTSNALSISKSEANFTKQIDQQGVLLTTMQKGIDDKIDDLKSRMTMIEGRRQGIGDGWGYLVGALGILAAVAAIAISVVKH